MWWIWLVPSVVVVAALTLTAVAALDTWRGAGRLRRRVGDLRGQLGVLATEAERVRAAAPRGR